MTDKDKFQPTAGAAESDARDIGPDNGRRPDFATPIDEGAGAVGSAGGYSGQEYDAPGQERWRHEQERRNVDPSGEVDGSGVGAGGGDAGEDFDVATPGGAEPGALAAGRNAGE